MEGIENVVFAVAVRVYFRFALFLRRFLVFAFRAAGTGACFGVDESFDILRLVYSLVFGFGTARFRFEVDFVAAFADFLVHYPLFGAELGDLLQVALAQFVVVFAQFPFALRVGFRMHALGRLSRLSPAHYVVYLLFYVRF